MLTRPSSKVISLLFQYSTLFRTIPFRWDSKKSRLKALSNSDLVPSVGILGLVALDLIYKIVSYFELNTLSSATFGEPSLHFYWITCATITFIFSSMNIFNRDSIADYLNHYFKWVQIMEDEAKLTKKKIGPQPLGSRSCHFFLRIIFFMTYVQSLFVGVMFFLTNPEAKRYGHFRLLNMWNLNRYVILVACCALEYAFFIICWYVTLLNLVIILVHWYSMSYWLQLLKHNLSLINSRGMDLTICSILLDKSLRFYNTLQVLEKLFACSVSGFALPWLHFLLVFVPAVCNYVVIRSLVSLVPTLFVACLTAFCFAFVLYAFPIGASIYVQSVKLIQLFSKLENQGMNLSQKKRIRAARPLRIQAGQIFIRPSTVLKLIYLMISWTVRSLLIFK